MSDERNNDFDMAKLREGLKGMAEAADKLSKSLESVVRVLAPGLRRMRQQDGMSEETPVEMNDEPVRHNCGGCDLCRPKPIR